MSKKFLNIEKNSRIAISPYNDISINLEKFLLTNYNMHIVGYIDSYKKGTRIHHPSKVYLLELNFILITSSKFNNDIYKNLLHYTSKEKIVLLDSKYSEFNKFKYLKNNLDFFYINKRKHIKKYINIYLMIFIFIINPKKLYKYSWRRCLPSTKGRDMVQNSFANISNYEIKTNFKYDKKINYLYLRGSNENMYLDENKDEILVNVSVNEKNRTKTFITADNNVLNEYIKEKVNTIFVEVVLVDNNNNNKNLNTLDKEIDCKKVTLFIKTNNDAEYFTLGSGITSIIAIYLISSKLNVYGFNHYLDKKISDMHIFEFFQNCFFYKRDFRTFDFVEYSLYHLFFSNNFNNFPNLFIEGNQDYFKNKKLEKFITKRLNKIFLKV